jgi:hypothetical protein
MREIKSLELWYVNNIYYLRAYSVTTAGLGYCANNAIHIIPENDIERLPEEIMKTLTESKQGIPHPDFRIKQENEMLKAVALKTEKTLMKEGKSITLYLDNDHFKISPYYFNGKHLTSTLEMKMQSSLDPKDIIRTVQEALTKCEKPIK